MVHLISHNHWDREWIFTANYTNRWLVSFFDNLLRVLETQPEYRFVLDGQTAIIEDYLSQLSPADARQCEQELSKYVKQNRLLVGPAYLQPDWALVSGEALVRNLMVGHKMAEKLGGVMKAGWMLDNFGQIAQAPQICKGFGIDGVFIWRGVAMDAENLKSEFWWESPDGSTVLAIYLINSYRNAMVLSLTREIAGQRILSEAQALRCFASTPNVLLMNGYEQVPWPDDVLPIIKEFNHSVTENLKCVQSTPPEYLEAIRSFNPNLPRLKGYLYSGFYMPVLKGVFSSRSHLKLLNNECQRELERWAEPFATIAWMMGAEYPKDKLEKAWKTLMLNQAHDDMCGCSIDKIARDMESRFAEVYQSAYDISETSLRTIADAVDTSRADSLLAIVVFNPSPRVRSDVISFSLDLPASVESFSIKDGGGKSAPYQITRRDENKVDLFLYATDIPSLGYKTYYLKPGSAANELSEMVIASAEGRTLENGHLFVHINADGTLNVTEKASGHFYENLGHFEDGGDAGDTYDYSFPACDQVITSLGEQATISLVERGPLLARFRVEINLNLSERLTEDRQSRSKQTRRFPIVSYVELTAGSRRVEVKTLLTNIVKDHRLRVIFPTGIQSDYAYAEEPFDVAKLYVAEDPPPKELPERVRNLLLAGRYTRPINTHPFQNFVDYSDGTKGLAIISRRVTEYEVLPETGAIALTLLRSVGWLARYDLLTRVGDVGPHIFTPEAQCLGEHVFHYAIYPHGGDWFYGKTPLEAFSHNLRLRAVQTYSPGVLPDELGFVSLTTDSPEGAFRLTALKRSESGDGVIIRFFNTLETAVQGEARTWWTAMEKAFRVNLNEEEQDELLHDKGLVKVQAGQKEIVSLKLKLMPGLQIDAQYFDAAKLLPPLPPGDKPPVADLPPVLTKEDVQAEEDRVTRLEAALLNAKAGVYTLEDEIERTGGAAIDLSKQVELQKKKMEVATLTRQLNESRISALLNKQLFITNQIESELEEIGEAMSWSRTKKRASEYLVHYYESLLEKQTLEVKLKPK
ncbi:MAG: glycoside hydrolase family 38 C-terminal domain-containing protein [Acidobacteriota bacterium]